MNNLDKKYLKTVNSTCRSNGAIGKNAIIPRIVPLYARKTDKILDFGAGKDAMHTMSLRKKGYRVTAYEIGNNFNPALHDVNALYRTYNVVYASNVLNVQPNRMYLDMVLDTISCVLVRDGLFITNYPSSPRKCEGLGVEEMTEILEKYFRVVKRVKQAPGNIKITTPVWVCTK